MNSKVKGTAAAIAGALLTLTAIGAVMAAVSPPPPPEDARGGEATRTPQAQSEDWLPLADNRAHPLSAGCWEDSPCWDWRTMGNQCRGVGDNTRDLHCVRDARVVRVHHGRIVRDLGPAWGPDSVVTCKHEYDGDVLHCRVKGGNWMPALSTARYREHWRRIECATRSSPGDPHASEQPGPVPTVFGLRWCTGDEKPWKEFVPTPDQMESPYEYDDPRTWSN